MNINVTFKETSKTFDAQMQATGAQMPANFSELQTLKGDDGKSAYDIWLEQGNTGTDTDFIASLKGDKGDRGEQGIQGKQGERGLQGERGEKGEQGAQGIQGEKGADGKDGTNGKDGYTPVKGTDYYTEAEKAEMVQAVLSALPVYNGEVITV